MNEKILQLAYKSGFVHEHMTTGEMNDKLKAFEKIANLIIQEYERQTQQQEPVAWLDKEKNIIYMHNTHKTDDYHGFKRTTPLYTEPPKHKEGCAKCGKLPSDGWALYCLKCSEPMRGWVGLTDEEIAQGLKESWVTEQAFKSAVWWAEQKLKEKNA
jgi:hypothetical protein